MACNSINSTIEIFTVALLGTLMISILLKKKKNKREKLFLFVLLLHMINTLGDLAAWRFAGKPGATAILMTTAGNNLTYYASVIVYFLFLVLIYLDISTQSNWKAVNGKILAGVICAGSFFHLFILFYNSQSGIIYTLYADNTFTWGAYSGLPDILVLIQLGLLLPLIILNRQYSIRKSISLFLLYSGAPIVAIILEFWYATLMLLYPTVAISMLIMYANMQHEQEKMLLEQEKLLLQQRLELSDGRIKLLLGQIQPHFIFNSLQAIQELCVKNPEKAEQAVRNFSKYLRGNLEALTCNHLISFEKELDHIRHYLALEMTDTASKLHVDYRLEVTDFEVPVLSVQPIVENAVRHGIGTRAEGGNVTISTQETKGEYVITIQDDGVGLGSATVQQQQRMSVGLDNVRTRLADQCGGTLVTDSDAQGTVVTIIIPKDRTE